MMAHFIMSKYYETKTMRNVKINLYLTIRFGFSWILITLIPMISVLF